MTTGQLPPLAATRRLGNSDLVVSPLCLGGNVFGWTADPETSKAVLDAYADMGGNFVDTADQYSQWVPGNAGGESETIVGDWMADRGNRDDMIIATKVGKAYAGLGLSGTNIRERVEGSLRRLRTDHIDLYYAHRDDPDVPMEETLAAFDDLVRSGKVRHIAASNFTADRLRESLELSAAHGLAQYVVLQNHYNLLERKGYEGAIEELVAERGMSAVPFYGLAKGFLTGKYRGGNVVESARAAAASEYADERGTRVLAVLTDIANAHESTMAAVALAWLLARPTVAAPISSARTVDQLKDLVTMASIRLTADDVAALDRASS